MHILRILLFWYANDIQGCLFQLEMAQRTLCCITEPSLIVRIMNYGCTPFRVQFSHSILLVLKQTILYNGGNTTSKSLPDSPCRSNTVSKCLSGGRAQDWAWVWRSPPQPCSRESYALWAKRAKWLPAASASLPRAAGRRWPLWIHQQQAFFPEVSLVLTPGGKKAQRTHILFKAPYNTYHLSSITIQRIPFSLCMKPLEGFFGNFAWKVLSNKYT